MSDDAVIGSRRDIKKNADMEIVGARRDAKKRPKAPIDIIEFDKATLRQREDKPQHKRRRRSVTAKRNSPGFYLLVIATLTMITATLAAFFTLERYQPVGEALLVDPPFSAGSDGWIEKGQVTFDQGPDGAVTLRNDDPESRTYLKRTINLPEGQTLAYLKAVVSTERVVAGSDLWQRARIYLAQLDETGEPDWSKSHNLFRLRGTKSQRTVSQVFPIPSSVKQAALSLEMNNATGLMTIHDLKLYPVEEQEDFRLVAFSLMAVWAVLVLAAGIMIFKNIPSTKVRLAFGGMLGLFVVGLFMPASVRDGLIAWLHFPTGGEGGIEPDMIGHGVVFMIMAFLMRIGRPEDPIWLHLGCWSLIAIASEVLQLFTFDRQPSIGDFLVDGAGVVLGLTIAAFLPRVFPARFQT